MKRVFDSDRSEAAAQRFAIGAGIVASKVQAVLAGLWWGPLRRPFEAFARRVWGRRRTVLSGELRGFVFERGGLAQRLGIYELPVQDAISQVLRPGDVVYDVGGHRGFFALLAARRVGAAGKVFVFEPTSESRRMILEAAEQNGLDHIEALPWAVSDVEGDAEFFVQPETTIASLLPSETAERRTVRCLTLDAFAAAHPPPALIKIDVEGAEGRVLAGGRALLESVRPRLIVELHSQGAEAEVRKILGEYGYWIQPLARRSSARAAFPCHILAEPKGSQ